MAYPASKKTLRDAMDNIDGVALRIRTAVQQVRDSSAAGTATRENITALKRLLKAAEDSWAASVSSVDPVQLRDFVRSQKTEPTLDLSVEYSNMRDGATALRTWIHTNMPVDAGSGAVLERVSNADGTYSSIAIPAQNAVAVAFRAQCDAFIALIA